MKKKFKYLLFASISGLALTACTDTWDDHYGQVPDTQYGNASLYEVLSAQPELSDFCRVLDKATLFANSRQTPITYKELLSADQFFTVWAPVNGTFNADSLIELCQTTHGDSLVEPQFLLNHIARYAHSFGNSEDTLVIMLNGKKLPLSDVNFGTATALKTNIAARNGVVHMVKTPSTYFNNIYEAMFNLPEFAHMGMFFKDYEKLTFDESSSLPCGVEDGKTVYIDSVFYKTIFGGFGPIYHEDSLVWMLAPTKEVWDPIYEEAKSYYDYSNLAKGDSITNYLAHYAVMQDLFFVPKKWRQKAINDSIVSNSWYGNERGEHYNVYYKPFEPGGIFAQDWKDSVICSNGKILVMNSWPFTKEQLYFKPITLPTYAFKGLVGDISDYGGNAKKTKTLNMTWYTANNDSVKDGYLSLVPEANTEKYFVEFEIPSVLSGKYDIYVVVLPKSVNPNNDMGTTTAGIRNKLPNKFTVELYYKGKDNKDYYVESKNRYKFDASTPGYYEDGKKDTSIPYLFEGNAVDNKGVRDYSSFVNDPLRVDTIKLCTMQFPTCNYGQTPVTNHLVLINNVKSSEARNYADYMYISAVLLKPHSDN